MPPLKRVQMTPKSGSPTIVGERWGRDLAMSNRYYDLMIEGRARVSMDDEDLNQLIHVLVDLYNDGKEPERQLRVERVKEEK